jgi:Cu(I)/Ag(I) efflux system membrane fusion protein
MKLSPTHALVSLLVVAAAAFTAGRMSSNSGSPEGAVDQEASVKEEVWTCSMHPQVRQPEPGKCPICFMDLIPATEGSGAELGPRTLTLTESAIALAEVATAPVERRAVEREVEMVGKVAIDQTRISYISARVPGRLDQLFVDSTGVRVRADDHLAEIYSPELYSAQQELLQALEAATRIDQAPASLLRSSADRNVHSAREKLRLYGFSDVQLEELIEQGHPSEHVTLFAPTGGVVLDKQAIEGMYVKEGSPIYTIADLSKVWVMLSAYESDLAWLRYGQDVQFEVAAYPGEVFHGRVALIDPLLDDRTRTVAVRLNVANDDGRLKPEMFVRARALAELTADGQALDQELAGRWMCPMHPEVTDDEASDCPECGMDLVPVSDLGFAASGGAATSLVIPRSAPLLTGRRAVVYVRLPDTEQPTFEGRVVRLGPRAGDWYVVLDGLAEGEQVVVRGNFKLDSELEIRGKLSMMNPSEAERSAAPALEVPQAFRALLGELVLPAVDLQVALADDRDSPEAAERVARALDAVAAFSLMGPAGERWSELSPPLLETTATLVGAADLAARRDALRPFTGALLAALDGLGYELEGPPVGLFHCPMAFDGEGGDWLQRGDVTANPYYGSEMLRCGSLVRTIGEEH